MTDIALLIAVIAAQAIGGFVVLKLLPSAISKFVDKEIERRSDIKLEKVKGEIQGSYSTLKSSVDMLTASNSGLHPHIIETVSAMWGLIVEMRHTFAGLVTFDQIILAEEAVEAFKKPEQNQKILDFVRAHEGDLQNPIRNAKYFESDLDRHRLFCGDRLWMIFYVMRAVLMRNSLLIAWSFQKGEYRDWRKDNGINQLLSGSLKPDFLEKVKAAKFGGISMAMSQLEADFLHEATRVMSGSKAMADSLADVQALMLLQNAKIAEQGK